MYDINEIFNIVCLLIVIIDFIIWIIYHNKVKKYKNTGKEKILYIAPNCIDYNNNVDREYLIYERNCKIEKATLIIPFILLILELIII